MNEHPIIRWTEAGLAHSARWRSEKGTAPHKRVVIADEQLSADTAYRLACEGTALLWRGDFQNARQMLQAMARRADENSHGKANPDEIQCTLEARLAGHEPVVVKDRAGSVHQAINGAVGKLKRAVATVLEKHDPRRHAALPDDVA